jgi:hypothetical protein
MPCTESNKINLLITVGKVIPQFAGGHEGQFASEPADSQPVIVQLFLKKFQQSLVLDPELIIDLPDGNIVRSVDQFPFFFVVDADLYIPCPIQFFVVFINHRTYSSHNFGLFSTEKTSQKVTFSPLSSTKNYVNPD